MADRPGPIMWDAGLRVPAARKATPEQRIERRACAQRLNNEKREQEELWDQAEAIEERVVEEERHAEQVWE